MLVDPRYSYFRRAWLSTGMFKDHSIYHDASWLHRMRAIMMSYLGMEWIAGIDRRTRGWDNRAGGFQGARSLSSSAKSRTFAWRRGEF